MKLYKFRVWLHGIKTYPGTILDNGLLSFKGNLCAENQALAEQQITGIISKTGSVVLDDYVMVEVPA